MVNIFPDPSKLNDHENTNKIVLVIFIKIAKPKVKEELKISLLNKKLKISKVRVEKFIIESSYSANLSGYKRTYNLKEALKKRKKYSSTIILRSQIYILQICNFFVL